MFNVQAIGAPFDINFSSCGKLVPQYFKWTSTSQEIQVYIDNALISGTNSPRHNKKFGWFCESKIVKPNIITHIKNNLLKYKNSYNKIFTCDRELIALDPELFIFVLSGSNMPWVLKNNYSIYPKTKLISLISSSKTITSGHINRIKMAEQFKNKVDFYGGIFDSEKIGTTTNAYHHCSKEKGLNDYMFSVTIENCKYDDYFTEKITDCFATGTIPIYYGTDNICNYFDKDGIVILNKNFNINMITEDLYYEKLKHVKNNLEIVSKMNISDDLLFLEIQKIL